MRTKETAKSLYLKEVFSKEDDILRSIREYSEKKNVEYMQISAYEGGILQFLMSNSFGEKSSRNRHSLWILQLDDCPHFAGGWANFLH